MLDEEKDPQDQDLNNQDPQDQDPAEDPKEEEDEEIDVDDEEDVETLKTKAKTLFNQKASYRKKLEIANKEIEDLRKKTNQAPEPKTPQKKQDAFKIESGARAEFRQDHPELTREDVNEIQSFAESHKIQLEEAVTKPMVKAFLEKQREKRDLDDGIPSSSRSGTSKRETNVDWLNMDEASFKKKRQNILSQRQNGSR